MHETWESSERLKNRGSRVGPARIQVHGGVHGALRKLTLCAFSCRVKGAAHGQRNIARRCGDSSWRSGPRYRAGRPWPRASMIAP